MDDTLRELAALATSLGLGDSPEPAARGAAVRSPSLPLERPDEPEDATAGVTIASPDATLKPDAADFALPACEELRSRPLPSRAAVAAVSPARAAALAPTPASAAIGAGLASPAVPSCAGGGGAAGGTGGGAGRPVGSAVARAMHALQEKVNRLVSAARARPPAPAPSRASTCPRPPVASSVDRRRSATR